MVHDVDGLGPLGHQGLDGGRIDVEAVAIHVGKADRALAVQQRPGGGPEGLRRDDDFVALLEAQELG